MLGSSAPAAFFIILIRRPAELVVVVVTFVLEVGGEWKLTALVAVACTIQTTNYHKQLVVKFIINSATESTGL